MAPGASRELLFLVLALAAVMTGCATHAVKADKPAVGGGNAAQADAAEGSAVDPSHEELRAGAEAAYHAIEPEFVACLALSLPKDSGKLKAALEAKQKALAELQKRYTEIVSLDAPGPAVCSHYRIGLLYQDFADKLMHAPVPEMPFPREQLIKANAGPFLPYWNVPWAEWPKDLQDALPEAFFAQLKQQIEDARREFEQAYREQLQRWGAPLREKAAQSFAFCLEKGRELSVVNSCTDGARAQLAKQPDVLPATAPAPED